MKKKARELKRLNSYSNSKNKKEFINCRWDVTAGWAVRTLTFCSVVSCSIPVTGVDVCNGSNLCSSAKRNWWNKSVRFFNKLKHNEMAATIQIIH